MDHTDEVGSEAVILPALAAPVKEMLASRTGITQTPVLIENFNKLRIIVSAGIKLDGSQHVQLRIKRSRNISKIFEISNVQRRIFQCQRQPLAKQQAV